jgi:hypothetical protein
MGCGEYPSKIPQISRDEVYGIYTAIKMKVFRF